MESKAGPASKLPLLVVVAAALLCAARLGMAQAPQAQGTQKNPDKEPMFFESDQLSPLRSRIYSEKNSEVEVWIKDCDVEEVRFEEKERQSRIYEEIRKLTKAVRAKGKCDVRKFTYDLKHMRGSLKVTALDKQDKELAAQTVITGPREHLFLSIDLPLSNRKTLKFDSTSKTLQPRDTNSQFYVALNYMLGDVLAEKPSWKTDPITVKALFRASSRPLDSLGVALGYTIPHIDGAGISPVTLFVGRFWTKEDRIDNGALLENDVYAKSWRIGVSYNLDDALKWVKF